MSIRRPTQRSSLRAVVLASAVCLLGTAQALASEWASELSTTVSYNDLNLATLAGASTLYRRIKGAARWVCGDQGRRFEERRHWSSCYHGAIDQAVATVNSPLLSTLHSGATRAPGSDVTALRTP